MASLHRDPRSPNGVWYTAYRLANGRRVFRSTGQRTKSAARTVAEAWELAEREARRGDLTKTRVSAILNETLRRLGQAPVESLPVKAWLENWLASKQSSLAPKSFLAYRTTIREFLGHLGEQGASRRLEAVTEIEIQGFLESLRESGRSANTINTMRSFLFNPFEKARKLGRIPYNPVAATSREKSDHVAKQTFSGAQIAALLAVADNDWRGATTFGYSTGARLTDVANLPWSALDVANGLVVYVEGKTKARAVLGLHPDFLDWLGEQPVPADPQAPVFPGLAGRDVGGERGLSNEFKSLITAAGIDNALLRPGNAKKGARRSALSFHSLRHTAASAVFNSAAVREVTRRVTNHAVKGSLDRYLHEDIDAIKSAVNLIPRLPL